MTVLRDNQEKAGYGWQFNDSEWCIGTRECSLHTGDYTLEGLGLEKRVILERKRDTKEIAANIYEERFTDELARLSVETDYAFVVCEFPWSRLAMYPAYSGLPLSLQRKAGTTGHFLVKRVSELMLDFPRVHWQFCDNRDAAQNFARTIFKRLVERCLFASKQRNEEISKNNSL